MVITNLPSDDRVEAVLAEAKRYLGVKEEPIGSNHGTCVSYWLKEAGVADGLPWCAAFVHSMGVQALGRTNWKLPTTASVAALAAWGATQGTVLKTLPKRGDVFLLWEPGLVPARFGHTGFVTSVNHSTISTIEGNTNDGGSREGFGVFARERPIQPSTRYLRWVEA